MLEIEMKFRAVDATAFERNVAEKFGATFGAEELEEDLFFRNAANGFPNEGKSLRIRRRGEFLAATYKGPRVDSTTKTREELELPLAREASATVEEARNAWIAFFTKLGFEPAARVAKRRRRANFEFEGRRFEATLDRLEGLGTFAELETQAPSSEFEVGRAATTALARELGLRESESRSYLALALESAERSPTTEEALAADAR